MKTNDIHNADLANSNDRKIVYAFAKEMYFDEKTPSNESTTDRCFMGFLKLPRIKVSASGVSSSHQKNLSQKQDFDHLISTNSVIDSNFY